MEKKHVKSGFVFTKHVEEEQSLFEKLFDIFQELITHTSGDFDEAIDWLKQLDEEYELTTEDYTIDDFVNELIEKGYVREKIKPDGNQGLSITEKTERSLRKRALEQIFGKLRKSGGGDHRTKYTGRGDELAGEFRNYRFGDALEQISMTESLKNSQINHGLGDFRLTENDLVVEETKHKSQMSTVLMIDISHSMILYGEDRITPAKKVAMALAELIKTRYPKDTLDIIVFGNDAWQIEIKDLPYLQVGPYHTNTVAGLQLAMDLLRRRKNPNKQIFMITDGKPTCMKVGIKYYKNAFGIDSRILSETLKLAAQCRKLKIPVTTFMIASDPYLKEFVKEFTKVNNGNAYYSSLKGLGDLIFEDYKRNRTKRF